MMDRCFYIHFPEVSAVAFSFSCISNESLPVISIALARYQSVVTVHVCAVTWHRWEASSLEGTGQLRFVSLRNQEHRTANMGLQVLEAACLTLSVNINIIYLYINIVIFEIFPDVFPYPL